MIENNTYLVITPFFPSKNSFVGSYIFDQLIELKKQTDFNIQVVKITSFFSTEKDYVFKDISVRIFRIIDFPGFIFPGVFNLINKKRFKVFLLKKKIQDIEIVHCHVSYPSIYLVEDLNCKKIIQHHGLDALQLMNGRFKFLRDLHQNCLIKNTINHLNNADVNIGVSNLVLDTLRGYEKYNPKKEFVLYNGVDTSKFFYKNIKKNEIFTIGCVANFWEIKDHITLIKAVHELILDGCKIKLRLIGSGLTLNKCKRYVILNELSKHIRFEKEIAHEELNDFYNEIDLFVMPSYYEALGCVYLESWATNTPFLAVEGQGISELMSSQDKMKYLIIKKSVDSLKNKILVHLNVQESYLFNPKFDIRYTIKDFIINCLR